MIFWWGCLLVLIGVMLYQRTSLLVGLLGAAVWLVCVEIFSSIGIVASVFLWLLWIALIPLAIPVLRQQWITRPILKIYQKLMPKLSKTEREALAAGTVWWDGELSSGRPDWKKLMEIPKASLSEEEQAFLNGPVETLCGMINDWEIVRDYKDLPPALWEFIKAQGFFGLIIPKEYGGKGFSALAHSKILVKLFSCSVTVASTVAVPNSLGPAELILHYGTEGQKNYYLPRLAKGEEIPCFALTSPQAGSDAAAMIDYGIICRKSINGNDTLGIRLTWNKRYITLAPVATVLGLAFKLYDPEHHLGEREDLGITCALIPTTTPGVVIGRRHIPAGAVFQNGPTQGEDVFIPLDWIIGGEKMIGQGWRMLVECLSVGRSISLPASGVASGQLASFGSGAYARIRRQFNMAIGCFEGVEEVLARIIGRSYQASATAFLTVQAIDRGEKPAVLSGISKYHCTEIGRAAVSDALDIHGGKGICLGPSNYLGLGYQGAPIGITVEGANILTRNMIIYGQGSIRCHPYVLKELEAAQKNDVAALDQALFSHVGFMLSNAIRSLVLGLTGSRIAIVPNSRVSQYFRHLTRFSAVFALLSDMSMLILGGELKRRERISARLGDMLSYLYIASASLHRYVSEGLPPEEYPVVKWACEDSLFKLQQACDELLNNYPNRWIRVVLRCFIFPWGKRFTKPSDRTEHTMVVLMLNSTKARQNITADIYKGSEGYNQMALFEQAMQAAIAIEPIEKLLRYAKKEKKIQGRTMADLVKAAEAISLITSEEVKQWREADKLRSQVIRVDDFSKDLLQ